MREAHNSKLLTPIVKLSFGHFVKMKKRKGLSDSYSIIYKIYIIL